jgi:pimeloyl-ACP methyl ester carboxylesterase
MINQTLTAVPGGIEYDTVYPAGDNTQDLGTEDILRYIHAGIAACPSQKYVLLGYSQGATSTAAALNNITDTTSAAYKAIKAAVVIGNPGHVANQTANYDQNGGKATNQFNGVYNGRADIALISPVWYNSGKLRDICYVNDLVCVGLTPSALLALFIPHLLYGSTPSVQEQGSDFIIPLLK